jgi:DNA-binding MarR family transcriptional regulator
LRPHDRCSPVPIPLRSRSSDTGSVCTYLPSPLAASSRTTTGPAPPTGELSVFGNALAGVSLDRFLELLHREDLSPVDVRVLLRVTDREATVRELANSTGQHAAVVRRASTHLVARGLLRRRRRPTADRRLDVTLAATASGMDALCRVTHALGLDLAVPETPYGLADWPANKVERNGDAAGGPSAAATSRSETGVRAG